VDRDWAVVRQKEREDAIKRAKELMRNREPRVRNFHSQLLMSSVLHERDGQLEHKVQQLLHDKIQEKEEILKMRRYILKDLEKAKQSEDAVVQKRLDFALGLRDEIRQRAKERESLGNVLLNNIERIGQLSQRSSTDSRRIDSTKSK
jgi:hypothetical protein